MLLTVMDWHNRLAILRSLTQIGLQLQLNQDKPQAYQSSDLVGNV